MLLKSGNNEEMQILFLPTLVLKYGLHELHDEQKIMK